LRAVTRPLRRRRGVSTFERPRCQVPIRDQTILITIAAKIAKAAINALYTLELIDPFASAVPATLRTVSRPKAYTNTIDAAKA